MAEFSEVMRQWRRMCAAFKKCEECPQYREYQCYNTAKRVFEHGDIGSLESNVMKWAAEHPEPKYPTWWEWLENMGIVSKAKSEYSEIFDTICVGTKMFDSIPADIAQKLGIEPKKG